jgi:4-amino-4-deoxy-L-arabinose transferase-like glycosyltransferase
MKRNLDSLLPFAVVAAFALVILLFLPFRFKFEFDTDEGIQLMKAFLYLKGHALQTEIFSDQPPFFTLVLSLLFRLFGPEVIVGRLATLAFACLLLTCAALYIKLFHGRTHYLVALLFLITLPGFPEMSVSAMIGLPSLSLAMASLLLLGLWHRRGRTGWLLLSALVLALSVLTKAFSLILVPVMALAILAHVVARPSWGPWRPG